MSDNALIFHADRVSIDRWTHLCGYSDCLEVKRPGKQFCATHHDAVRYGSFVARPDSRKACLHQGCANPQRTEQRFCYKHSLPLLTWDVTPKLPASKPMVQQPHQTSPTTNAPLDPATYSARERQIARAAYLDASVECWRNGINSGGQLERWSTSTAFSPIARAAWEQKAKRAFPAPPAPPQYRIVFDAVIGASYRYNPTLKEFQQTTRDPRTAQESDWVVSRAIFSRMFDGLADLKRRPFDDVVAED